jgi:hypothetical protein
VKARVALVALSLAACEDPKTPERHPCPVVEPLESDTGPNVVPLLVRLENRLSPTFEAVNACIFIDQRSSRTDSKDLADGFAAHHPLELRLSLDPAREHVISVIAQLTGASSPYRGYRFVLKSKHTVLPEDLKAGLLVGTIFQKPNVPLEEAPTIEWAAPPP